MQASKEVEKKDPESPECHTLAEPDVFHAKGDVTAPRPSVKPEPGFSEKARLIQYQGKLKMWAVINAQGDIESVRIVQPLGLGLDQNALRTVRGWKFKPATRNGTLIPTRVLIEISFRLF